MKSSSSTIHSNGLGHRPARAGVFRHLPGRHYWAPAASTPLQARSVPHADLQNQSPVNGPSSFSRREAIVSLTLLPSLFLADPSSSQETAASFTDAIDCFSVSIPDGWVAGTGEKDGGAGEGGSQRIVVWYPNKVASASEANVTLVITNVGADFTKLGSFGTPYEFGTAMVASMDRSYLLRAPEWVRKNAGPIQTAKLLDATSVGPKYRVDYVVDKPEEGTTRLLSLVSLGYNGTHNRLYTLTAQCREGDFDKYERVFDQFLGSFQPPHER